MYKNGVTPSPRDGNTVGSQALLSTPRFDMLRGATSVSNDTEHAPVSPAARCDSFGACATQRSSTSPCTASAPTPLTTAARCDSFGACATTVQRSWTSPLAQSVATPPSDARGELAGVSATGGELAGVSATGTLPSGRRSVGGTQVKIRMEGQPRFNLRRVVDYNSLLSECEKLAHQAQVTAYEISFRDRLIVCM
jgi:hypothetical protein